jgi:death on curing protein
VREPIWIRTIEVYAFHELQITLFGGALGVRDNGLLESALARPKNHFAYSDPAPGICVLAAAYAAGISSNHPFLDGNKRTAMHVAFVFLEFNGLRVTASEEDAYLTILGLAAGEIFEEELAAWFERNTQPR